MKPVRCEKGDGAAHLQCPGCQTVDDVCAPVRFGTQNGLRLAVRGGGHSAQGYGTWDDALVIDLSPLNGVEVDPASSTVCAQRGVTWGQFDQATQEQGLAVTGGRFSTTRRCPADPRQRQRLARAALRADLRQPPVRGGGDRRG